MTANSVDMKETHENTDLLLKGMSYSIYAWKMCGDLKVIGLRLGMQSGYAMLCCFLCEREGRAKYKHYKSKDWPMRENSVPGKKGVRNQPLVNKEKFSYRQYTSICS